MENKKVQILLSTYNGEKYIEEQLQSLLNQSHQNIHILIRDDGSTDNTINILKKYEETFPNKIKVILKSNVGVIKSFFEVINFATLDSEFYSFCDQDDFWEKDKIKMAIKQIEEEKEEIVGYCSNLNLVDENLKFLKKSYLKILKPSLKNSLFENIVTGCTFVCNKSLFKIIKEEIKKIEVNNIPMHDHYFYFITCLYGKLIYDNHSYILYRQHSNNVIGMEKNNITKFIKRMKKVLLRNNKSQRILFLTEIFLKYKEKLRTKEFKYINEILESYNSFFKRLRIIFKLEFVRQNKIDSFLMKISYLLKKF